MTAAPLRALPIVFAAAWPFAAGATGAEPAPQVRPAVPMAVPVAAAAPDAPATAAPSGTQLYCRNIAAAAGDARFAWQTRQLKELEAQLAQRVRDLDAKAAELKDAVARHEAVMKRAADSMVGIYAHMKPDAAAAQLSQMDDDVAAAVIAQLNPRQSSAILNEISPDRAVHLMNAIANPTVAEGKKS